MKNPCENCVVGMVCSEICPPKENYGKLIKQGYKQHFKTLKLGNEQYRKKFNHYSVLLEKHRTDLARILGRRELLFFTPSSRVPK